MIVAIYILVFTLLLAGSPAWAGGWYLMVAPSPNAAKDDYSPDPDRPLATWHQQSAHDTASDCEEARRRILNFTRPPDMPADKWIRLTVRWTSGTLCIASDDPRLKGK